MSLRPFEPDDHDAVNALHRGVWWPERSHAGWAWLATNPARLDIGAPSGWVVPDRDGAAAAFMGNLVQRVWKDERLHHVATGFSVIVPPAVRGKSRALIRAVLDQPNIAAGYTLNANPKSAPLYARHGMRAWPARTNALKLSWIVDPIDCLRGRLLREAVKRAPHLTDPYRERFLRSDRALGRVRRPRFPSLVSTLTDLSDGSPYCDFWRALKGEGRAVADRSPEILRWRIADPDQAEPPLLLAYTRDGAVTGYAMAIQAKATPIDPVFLEVLDLVALEDEPHAIPALMRALMDQARTRGAAKVRLQVVNEELKRRLGAWALGARHEGGWGHGHLRFRNGADAGDLATWSPTPFDGDHGVCQRPAPRRQRATTGADLRA
ncbi:N-acetyltransferase [Brevundimonas goettingensis]|uniref:N-acetyltransferase n=1 Tax=Brevundimonas goettingensis TaxID=2774190 RepID=A0A975GVW0_9CAUL|nr:N-acetyltransferase [Brevundimonas goettingensis]QTC91103.1 N-acetyltransferase [Brevundimonas goettingensis]